MKFLNGWTIDIPLIPKYSLLDSQLFIEQIDLKLSTYILENPNITDKDKTKFKNYILTHKDNIIQVKYNPRYLIGRRYADKDLGALTQKRCIKNTIFKYFGYIDLDQVKGHIQIINELALKNNVELPSYKKYLNEFDNVCVKLINFYNDDDEQLKRKHIKLLFNAIIYGGSFNTWKKEMIIEKNIKINNDNVVLDFIKDFTNDTKTIMNIIWEKNINLRNLLERDNETEYKLKSRMMSYFFQIIENEITYNAYIYLLTKQIVEKNKLVWGYDGLTFKPLKEFDINDLNDYINYKTNFSQVKFIQKELDEIDTKALNKKGVDKIVLFNNKKLMSIAFHKLKTYKQ